MLALGYIFGTAQVFNPVRELHNVTVIRDEGGGRVTVAIPAAPVNPVYARDAVEIWTICPDGDGLTVRTGVVFSVVQYKQRKGCQFFDDSTEVKYLKNADNRVVDKQGKILFAKGEY